MKIVKQMGEMKNLIQTLNTYRDEYYNQANPSVSDEEYDLLFDKLAALEKETGVYMSNSPTQSVGFEVKSKLEKIKHSHPMLSLDKTKSVDDLKDFAKDKQCLLSLKLDGLTVLLTYENGNLIQAETRGNGEEGELITHNAKVFENIPLHIDYLGHLEVEGEAIITYADFDKINMELPKEDKYKNPRNLASGSVRQLDSSIATQRHINFIAWKVPVIEDEINNNDSFLSRLNFIKGLGFETVPLYTYSSENSQQENLDTLVEALKNLAKIKDYPIDGLVMTYDDIKYGESLGMTGHHPRHSIAFKFYDDVYETTLREIEWGMGKTGQLTPVAIFNPVEIDGTEVTRASVHNVSILTELDLRPGDTITVYKANAIIPQIDKNLSKVYHISSYLEIPTRCPICDGVTELKRDNGTAILVCTNDDCQGKLLGKLSHAVSKNALDIAGMSEATLEFLIEKNWVKDLRDLFRLKLVAYEWSKEPGFGEKSVIKLLSQIEEKRSISLERFIYAQCIPLIGRTASKQISRFCNGSIDEFCKIISDGNLKMFTKIDGFGETMCDSLANWMDKHWIEFLNLKREFYFVTEINENKNTGADLNGATFCITGKLEHFANRDALVANIEQHGGKYVSSVSAKTNYLINNDVNSTSDKNAKAKQVGCTIISEQDYLKLSKLL